MVIGTECLKMPFVLLPFEANVLIPIQFAEGIKVVSVIFAKSFFLLFKHLSCSLYLYFADSGAKTEITGHS